MVRSQWSGGAYWTKLYQGIGARQYGCTSEGACPAGVPGTCICIIYQGILCDSHTLQQQRNNTTGVESRTGREKNVLADFSGKDLFLIS